MGEQVRAALVALSAALALVLAGAVAPPEDPLAAWAGRHLDLSDAAVRCIDRHLPRAVRSAGGDQTSEVARRGLRGLPIEDQSLAGNVIVACALMAGDAR